MTREEVATIFYRLTIPDGEDIRETFEIAERPFEDVEMNRWSTRAISYMKMLEIMSGYPSGKFEPTKPITRAEFAEVIKKFATISPTSIKNTFNDVAENFWATDAVKIALAEGWIQGYKDGTFKPEQNITRAETVTIINRMLKRLAIEENISKAEVSYKDLDSDHWAYKEIIEASMTHDFEYDEKDIEIWK